jgi:hypothetical protein
MFSDRFLLANGVLICVQAALVALPGRGVPGLVGRLGGRAWALVPPVSIGAVVAAIVADPSPAGG